MEIYRKEYIHSSWQHLNLKNIFLQYNNIIEKLNNINIEYEPKDEKDILSFFGQDITNVIILYLRYYRIDEYFLDEEKTILGEYVKDKKIMSLAYNLTSFETSNINESYSNIWSNLIKEIILLLSNKILFINVEKNLLFTKNMYKNICNNIMIYNYELKPKNSILLYNSIIKLNSYAEEHNLKS
jgi:hypothetical protein